MVFAGWPVTSRMVSSSSLMACSTVPNCSKMRLKLGKPSFRFSIRLVVFQTDTAAQQRGLH